MTYRSQQAADVQYLRNVDQVTCPARRHRQHADVALGPAARGARAHGAGAERGDQHREPGGAVRAGRADPRRGRSASTTPPTSTGPCSAGPCPGGRPSTRRRALPRQRRSRSSTRISRDATIRLDVKGSDVGADTTPALLDRIVADLASPAGVPAADFTDLDAEHVQGAAGARRRRRPEPPASTRRRRTSTPAPRPEDAGSARTRTSTCPRRS